MKNHLFMSNLSHTSQSHTHTHTHTHTHNNNNNNNNPELVARTIVWFTVRSKKHFGSSVYKSLHTSSPLTPQGPDQSFSGDVRAGH